MDVDGDADVPDNAFDLLPRIPYILPWPAQPDPTTACAGSQLVLGGRIVANQLRGNT